MNARAEFLLLLAFRSCCRRRRVGVRGVKFTSNGICFAAITVFRSLVQVAVRPSVSAAFDFRMSSLPKYLMCSSEGMSRILLN